MIARFLHTAALTVMLVACAATSTSAVASAGFVSAPPVARSHGVVTVNNRAVDYDTEVNETIVPDASGRPGARVITISYLRSSVADVARRPVLFAFNGGPGASSSPLHMQALGPMHLERSGDTSRLVENNSSPIDVADIVFIDPVSTGFSRALDGVDAKQWYNGRSDALEVSGVIRTWLTAHHREQSPRYLVGESYGTTRAGLILKYDPTLHFEGVILVSGGGMRTGANAEQINSIAAMAAGAWYHNRVDRAGHSVEAFYAEARDFAQTDYAAALAEGDRITPERKQAIAERLARYIGLSPALIEQHDLRIDTNTYMFNLLRDQNLRTGQLDVRVTSELSPNAQGAFDDPALGVARPAASGPQPTPASIGPVPSPAVGAYIKDNLHYATELPYYGVNFTANSQWVRGTDEDATAIIAARAMHDDPRLRLMAVSGFYDLGSSDNSGLEQAGVPRGRLTLLQTAGPHEVYAGEDNRRIFNDAVRSFVAPR